MQDINQPVQPPDRRPLPPQQPLPPTVTPLPLQPDMTQRHDGNKPPSAFRELLSTLGVLVTAFLVAVLVINFVFRSYQVDGPSMETTLHNADKLIIWKVPRTWARITHHAYLPARGDVIVFTQSGLSQYGQQDSKQLIKRVIALPGERVRVADGEITVFNKEHPEGFKPDKTLEYGKVIPTTAGDIDVTLAKDQLFVCGDNRPDSLDSRTFGPINASQVIGKLVLKVFPIDEAGVF